MDSTAHGSVAHGCDRPRETAFRRARREFPPVLTGSPRMWFWSTFWGLAGLAVGGYFSYDHRQVAFVGISVGAAAAGLVVALLTAFGALWASASVRSLGEDVMALSAAVAELQSREGNRPEPLRVALYAVRSELVACARGITEALERKRWWSPTGDRLPGESFKNHFAALSDPALPTELFGLIEDAYQCCNRLNHRIARYVEEHKRAQLMPMIPASVFALRDGDEERLREGLKKIDAAKTGISDLVERAQP